MTQISSNNDDRFEVIVKLLDSCGRFHEQLDSVDQINSSINDKYLVNLIENVGDINAGLSNTTLQGSAFRNLLAQSPELESIIKLTSQLDECIDDPRRFDEAINLLEFIDTIYKKYGHQVSIVEDLYKKSERQRDYLISSLCDKLEHSKDGPENQVFSIVGYLARCGDFSERDLKLKYLQARDSWFNNACEEQSSSFDNVVAIHMRGLPMIYQEYKSIFTSTSQFYDKNLKRLSSSNHEKEDEVIINSWLLLKATIFIASLEVYLKTIRQSGIQTPTMFGDTMQKCFELCSSLASIGFDFNSQLRPLFSRAIIEEVRSSIEKATFKFERSFANVATKSIESLLLPVEDEILRISNMNPGEQVPKSIEHYPIFKVYCLYIIDSLRWVKSTKDTLSPINICLDAYASLNASLTRVMKALATILNMDNNSTHPILSKIAISFVTEFLPFLVNYCEKLFPEKIILNSIGLSKADFKAMGANAAERERISNFSLDLRAIAEPLRSTMPALLQTIEY